MPRWFLIPLLALLAAACGPGNSGMPLGSAAPDFTLPGVDGKAHSLREYADSRVLAVVFTCNHCPASQMYETRLKKLDEDYRSKGVTLIAINPNKAAAMTLADLGHTDVGESLDDMKVRAAYRRLMYPYLSDGETQTLTKQFGIVTTPHIFVFDQSRTLQYQGRIDDNVREDLVKSRDAQNAIDALIAGRPVPTARTQAVGCAVKGSSGQAVHDAQLAKFESDPVTVDAIEADGLKRLRKNGTGKLLMVNFWATWCAPCVSEFPDLEATYRMYKPRNLEFITVSVNDPAERPAVVEFLQKQHASHQNRQFGTSDVYGLQAAFDPDLPAPVPFTLLLAPNGDVLYQELGASDIPKLRRAILANLPDDEKLPGQQAYWSAAER
jgi:thiol-disulfide isomerase/thioredoxin